MPLAERIREIPLSPRERKVADLLLSDPSVVAFGTVARVAEAAGVGNSTVMRFSTSAGFPGFRDLQAAVRSEMDGRLRQASLRVRRPGAGDPVDRAIETETANLHDTFALLDRQALDRAVRRLASDRHIAVLAGDPARGVALDLATQLGMVRAGVELVDVGSIAIARSTSWLGRDDVLVVVDTARYEETVTRAAERAAAGGVPVLAISDSHVSPIGAVARWSFQVVDTGAGPFDSFVAALALTNLLVHLVTRRLGAPAVRHLDRLDSEWDAAGVLRPD
ncbi:MAG: MurR/RpiR family transcriptional regulator [Acidimicrobiia bacterium]